MIAVDVSRWSAKDGLISREVWRTLRQDYQVGLAIVGAWHGASPNPGCQASLENALQEGLIAHTYTVLNGKSGSYSVNVARDIIGRPIWKELSHCWLDCELDGIQTSNIRAAFGLLDSLEMPSGIYTAKWWWAGHFNNYTGFAGRPLWNVVYDYDPDVDYPKAPYGGWELPQVWGEQYRGTSYVAGIFVDWNYFFDHHILGGTAMDHAELERRIVKNERGLVRVADVSRASGLFEEAASIIGQDDPEKPLPKKLKEQARFLLGTD